MLLPTSIKTALNQPPISDLVKVVGRSKIVIFLKVELIKLCERVSVGNKLNVEQLEFIATQLVEMFPNESLADFKLCFERGCIGQYGEIFRMDGIVIRKWIESYLDEKYQHVEQKLVQEKDTHWVTPADIQTDSQRLAEWKESIDKLDSKKVKPLSTEDILIEGQEQPPKPKGKYYPSTEEEKVKAHILHVEYIKNNYDPITGKPKLDWMDEESWKRKSIKH